MKPYYNGDDMSVCLSVSKSHKRCTLMDPPHTAAQKQDDQHTIPLVIFILFAMTIFSFKPQILRNLH